MFFCSNLFGTETWTITSLYWEPYSGELLPEGGAGIYALRKILKKKGIDLVVEYYPWYRSQLRALNDPGYIGYYPAWPEEVLDDFFASDYLFSSPVVMITRIDNSLQWLVLNDLSSLSISYVENYQYSLQLMKILNQTRYPRNATSNDLQSIKQVLSRRSDIAFIDLSVFKYYMSSDETLLERGDELEIDSGYIDLKKLVFAFSPISGNIRRAKILNELLNEIDSQKLIDEYFIKYGLTLLN